MRVLLTLLFIAIPLRGETVDVTVNGPCQWVLWIAADGTLRDKNGLHANLDSGPYTLVCGWTMAGSAERAVVVRPRVNVIPGAVVTIRASEARNRVEPVSIGVDGAPLVARGFSRRWVGSLVIGDSSDATKQREYEILLSETGAVWISNLPDSIALRIFEALDDIRSGEIYGFVHAALWGIRSHTNLSASAAGAQPVKIGFHADANGRFGTILLFMLKSSGGGRGFPFAARLARGQRWNVNVYLVNEEPDHYIFSTWLALADAPYGGHYVRQILDIRAFDDRLRINGEEIARDERVIVGLDPVFPFAFYMAVSIDPGNPAQAWVYPDFLYSGPFRDFVYAYPEVVLLDSIGRRVDSAPIPRGPYRAFSQLETDVRGVRGRNYFIANGDTNLDDPVPPHAGIVPPRR